MAWTVGVDLGGTKIALGLVDENGILGETTTIPTDAKEGADAVVDRMTAAIKMLIQQNSSQSICAVGIAAAGQVDSMSGTVIFGPNLDWHNFPIGETLRAKLGLPVYVINDVRAATWGEWCCGAGKGVDDLVCLFVGTGVGGGVIIAGRLLEGSSNCAGELGHITVAKSGRHCTCGGRGCLEAFAGGWAIAEMMNEKLAASNSAKVTAREVFKLAEKGDPAALQVTQEALEALVAGAITVVNAFNPARLLLGGGVIDGIPSWIEQIDKQVRKLALGTATAKLQVVKATLGNHAGIIGAALLAAREIKP